MDTKILDVKRLQEHQGRYLELIYKTPEGSLVVGIKVSSRCFYLIVTNWALKVPSNLPSQIQLVKVQYRNEQIQTIMM